MSESVNELETVIATVSMPEAGVLAGDLGTVVEVYQSPRLAYEVEFVNPDGQTRALLTLTPEQVRPLSANDIVTTRPYQIAA